MSTEKNNEATTNNEVVFTPFANVLGINMTNSIMEQHMRFEAARAKLEAKQRRIKAFWIGMAIGWPVGVIAYLIYAASIGII